MNDRGDKIVSLAQEILRNEKTGSALCAAPPSRTEDKKDVFKTAVIAALFSAVGMGFSAQAIAEAKRPATRYERVEIDALLFYTSRQLGQNEAFLRDEVQDFFSLAALQDMTAHDYKRIRHFLWLRLSEGKKNASSARLKTKKNATGK